MSTPEWFQKYTTLNHSFLLMNFAEVIGRKSPNDKEKAFIILLYLKI
jgi:hypothetical protein